MSLYIASLASGSNGNCYYIGNEDEAVLIDAGISCKETEKRMSRLCLDMAQVKAVFISHEHSDHIFGLPVLAKKYGLPVYMTDSTSLHGKLQPKIGRSAPFTAHQPVTVGGLSVTAFPKWHDACDPHSFTVSYKGITIGIFTDIGAPCEQVRQYFSRCHAAFLEANYDEEMLTAGRYPYHLKARIRGDRGHLSNAQALQLFRKHKPPFMSHLLLSHLSKDNNCPQLAADLFTHHAGATKIIIASRYQETDLYKITGSPAYHSTIEYLSPYPEQLTLF